LHFYSRRTPVEFPAVIVIDRRSLLKDASLAPYRPFAPAYGEDDAILSRKAMIRSVVFGGK
jgi:hypothetical protein